MTRVLRKEGFGRESRGKSLNPKLSTLNLHRLIPVVVRIIFFLEAATASGAAAFITSSLRSVSGKDCLKVDVAFEDTQRAVRAGAVVIPLDEVVAACSHSSDVDGSARVILTLHRSWYLRPQDLR